MPRFFFPLASLLLAILVASQAHAQQSKQPLLALAVSTTPTAPAARVKTIVLLGRVETTTGVLPGAIVEVGSNKNLRTVTDADGFFRLVIPATTSPVAVTASYAGYDEVSANLVPGALPAVLRLVVPHDNTKLLR
ncbi:carboxypeptidase-like regulatory domain-containing protein [Hymenobacter setariae]|uniref:carboxypeptidase-like regulatory domain-containing protein n=1 Tax=Hymenobacter setariae TaxID=2594794 RepID=UPI001F22822B|nr:carboxypeptidase-like regulatory domain-containing protein [Hymenobacter setariae]